MTDVKKNLLSVRAGLPSGVKLVAISKYHPEEEIMAAYEAGQRIFGESHEQEIRRKHEHLPKDIEWHFIGHLQTNKVRLIVPYIDMIEAVDSLKLLSEINRQAKKIGRRIKVLLEIHVAQENTKYGLTFQECRALFEEGSWRQMENVNICGLMMMATCTADHDIIRKEMLSTASFFDEIKSKYFADSSEFRECSWGMSSDYSIAVECRSTMVRVGTAIFGERVY